MNQTGVRKKILIIDDDDLSARVLAKRLDRRGYSAQTISSCSLAMEILNKEKIDLVLLDIVMPDMDGLTLLRQIRNMYNAEELPVIMVTAITEGPEIFDAFASGANDYITKPVNVEVAVSRINGQLSAVELRIDRFRKQEIEAISAIVITYHHEFNNPLAIAKSELQFFVKENKAIDVTGIKKALNALDRIETIVKKIKEITDKKDISYDLYADKSKMVNVNKS